MNGPVMINKILPKTYALCENNNIDIDTSLKVYENRVDLIFRSDTRVMAKSFDCYVLSDDSRHIDNKLYDEIVEEFDILNHNNVEINVLRNKVSLLKSELEITKWKLKKATGDLITLNRLAIDNVIFNGPATIVIWNDGTKTVVKAQNGEEFDKEKGLAMAIVKKFHSNAGRYNELFKKWCKED